MPYKDKQIEKIYYRINEVASLAIVATSAVRFWETKFDWLKVRKFTISGGHRHRRYTKDEANKVLAVAFLLDCGLSIKGVQKAKELEYLDSLLDFYGFELGTLCSVIRPL
jgi:DNA-binding transcriptional MerR regulator